MTDGERVEKRIPVGIQAYIVTLPDLDGVGPEEIILLRQYDIPTDTCSVRAFSPRQWNLANGRVGWSV